MRLDPITRAKKWLTIDETANELRRKHGGDIRREDVFQLAYAERLELSVILKGRLKVSAISFWRGSETEKEKEYTFAQAAGEFLNERIKHQVAKDLIHQELAFTSSIDSFIEDTIGDYYGVMDDFDFSDCFVYLLELWHERSGYLDKTDYAFANVPWVERSGYYPVHSVQELPVELVCTPQALEAFLVSVLEPQETPQAPTISTDELLTHPNASAHLKALISAFNKFWRNADLADSETYPTNKAVGEWIAQQYPNISSTKVRQMAEMLRHEDTPSGRRPENSGGI